MTVSQCQRWLRVFSVNYLARREADRARDRGYISQDLFEKLYEQQLQLITRYKKNMKQKLVKLIDKILLRKRSLIETVNDQLKNIFEIEHSRHRSIWNFLVNLMAGLIAYSYRMRISHCGKSGFRRRRISISSMAFVVKEIPL